MTTKTHEHRAHSRCVCLWLCRVCIQCDWELWFRFQSSSVCFLMILIAVCRDTIVLSFLYLSQLFFYQSYVFYHVQWCINIFSPFSVPPAIWQRAHIQPFAATAIQPIKSVSETGSHACNFRLFFFLFFLCAFRFDISMKCYDKNIWILKRTHVFLINASANAAYTDLCIWWMHTQQHQQLERNVPFTECGVRSAADSVNTIRCSIIIAYYCLCLSTNIYCLMHQNTYPSVKIILPFYVTQRIVCHAVGVVTSPPVTTTTIGRKHHRSRNQLTAESTKWEHASTHRSAITHTARECECERRRAEDALTTAARILK